MCNRQYLDERFLNSAEQGGDITGAPTATTADADEASDMQGRMDGADANALEPATLVQVLVAAVDMCLYCGSKFVG